MLVKLNLGLIYALTILLVARVLTKVDAMKYSTDEVYNDDEVNGKRRSVLAIANGMSSVGEDYGDMSDSEYLCRAIRGLTIDVSYLRRTVRDLYRNDLAAMRKVLDRLVKALIYPRLQPNMLPIRPAVAPAQSSMTSLLGLSNSGTLGGPLLSQGSLGIAQDGGGFGGFGTIPGAPTSLRDELAQLVDANLAQQTGGQFGQTSSFQNQEAALRPMSDQPGNVITPGYSLFSGSTETPETLVSLEMCSKRSVTNTSVNTRALLSGYNEAPGTTNGLGTGLSSAQNVPAQLLLSRLG